MAAGEQADEHALEHLVLTCDDALDLEQRGLEQVASLTLVVERRDWRFRHLCGSSVGHETQSSSRN